MNMAGLGALRQWHQHSAGAVKYPVSHSGFGHSYKTSTIPVFRGIGRCQVLYQNLGRNKLDFLVGYLVETLRLLCYEGNMPLSSHLSPSTEISGAILFIFTHMNPL